SFTGAVTEPRQVLDGGYLSWRVPMTGHLRQLFVDNGNRQFVDQGEIPVGIRSLRALSDRLTAARRYAAARHQIADAVKVLNSASGRRMGKSRGSNAVQLQREIEGRVGPTVIQTGRGQQKGRQVRKGQKPKGRKR